MFKVGDLVQHKTAKITGTVIGYGVRQTDGDRAVTLKVELKSDRPIRPIAENVYDLNEWIKPIAEDVCERWRIRQPKVLACRLPYFPQRKLSKAS